MLNLTTKNQNASHHQQFIKLFNPSSNSQNHPIDLYNLKHLVLHGIPDHPSHIRPLVWDLLLGINSPNSESQSIQQRRHEYHKLMSYFVQQLHPSVSDSSSISNNIDQTLRWIQADINRTQSDLQFFSTPFRLPPDSLAAIKLNVFLSHLNQTQSSHRGNSNIPLPSSSHSPSPSPSFSSAISFSSSSYYSAASQNKSNSSLPSSTPARTKSPLSPPTRLSTSFQPPSHQTPQIHSINTLLEPSSPSTPRLSIQAPSPINSPRTPTDLIVSFTHRDLLSRLLAVWSTLNSGIGYVQGMSDIAAVIVYVYSQSYHPTHHDQTHQVSEAGSDHQDVEADAFWAFSALVSNLRELFVNSLDGTSTRVESSFGKIFHRYAQQLDWLDPELSHHLSALGVDGKFYVLNWLGCLFTRYFELPELLRLWDSLLALNLDTHRASVSANSEFTSVNTDPGLINTLIDVCCSLTIQLGPALRQQETFEQIMDILQTVRAQKVSVEDVIKEVLMIRQKRFEAGLDEQPNQVTPKLPSDISIVDQNLEARDYQEPEIISDNSTLASVGSATWSGLNRLKTLAADVTQKIPSSSNVADIHKIDPHKTLGAGIFQKLKHTTEGWRDSDVAAEFSKKATNWSLMASSWSTNSLMSKLTSPNETSAAVLEPFPLPSFSPTNRRFVHAHDANLHATQFSSAASSPQASSQRWSKTSHTSNFSFDSPFQPPISSRSDSFSGSSSTLGSPINPNSQLAGIGNGPRPLLLSSRARTNVVTTDSGGKVQDMVNASIKRLSGFQLGMNFAQGNGQLDNSENHLHIAPVDRTSSRVRLAHDFPLGLHPPSSPSAIQGSVMVNIFSRSRARSVVSSPIRDRYKSDLSSKPERVSLPNNYHGRRGDVSLIQPSDHVNPDSDDIEDVESIQRRLMQSSDTISRANRTSVSSNRVSGDQFDDLVDEYVSFYGS